MKYRTLISVWLVAAFFSFPVTIGAVVLSGYRWNPYIVQLVFLGLCNLGIVWYFSRTDAA